MIIQGSNQPLVFSFEENYFENNRGIEISLFTSDGTELKHWADSEIETSGENYLICPLKQEETMNFPCGDVFIEIKFKDSKNIVQFFPMMKARVVHRYDHTLF